MEFSRGSVLLEGARNYGPTDSVSEELDKAVAATVNHLWNERGGLQGHIEG